MAENIRQIVWTKRSQVQMKNIYEYISKDSPQNALKIVNGIADEVSKAINNAEFYGPDKYKINNDGSYRAFEKYHYRISYRFTKNFIRILHIRHTKMEPKIY